MFQASVYHNWKWKWKETPRNEEHLPASEPKTENQREQLDSSLGWLTAGSEHGGGELSDNNQAVKYGTYEHGELLELGGRGGSSGRTPERCCDQDRYDSEQKEAAISRNQNKASIPRGQDEVLIFRNQIELSKSRGQDEVSISSDKNKFSVPSAAS
ncbi:hypothetical protein RRG08_053566 [Elysia crispata]|uniref:Uncharacterized protein n=1 Tax=Elysia crispata TaxID=231223 RepID=A0AAE0Y1F8_9GAST|nr:hypothetical protein RRG08_053566 [Elysia crispata]